MKYCSTCGVALTEATAYKSRRKNGALSSPCRECQWSVGLCLLSPNPNSKEISIMPKDPGLTPIKIKDLNLSPEEVKYLVEGAQKYLPPQTEEGEPIPTEPKE